MGSYPSIGLLLNTSLPKANEKLSFQVSGEFGKGYFYGTGVNSRNDAFEEVHLHTSILKGKAGLKYTYPKGKIRPTLMIGGTILKLFNIDGNGNRVAAMIFGPKSVIVVAGMNKVVKSLDDAINHHTPVIFSQIEMSGWSKTEKYISTKQTNIFVLKIFVIPDMNFSDYKNWLIKKRNDNDLEPRLNKTGWELKKAPQKADFIIVNHIEENTDSLTKTAQTIINQLTELLK